MSASQAQLASPPTVAGPEDLSRADMYAVIGRLFHQAPDDGLLARIADTELIGEGEDRGLVEAWGALRAACRDADAGAVEEEFNRLFISVAQSAINPFASFYLTGFLNDRPLAELRLELEGLGYGRLKASGETEDHLSALAEVMRLMILGGAGKGPLPVEAQGAFFSRFIRPWYSRLAADLEQSGSASFYKCVGRFTKAFFDVESASFEIG